MTPAPVTTTVREAGDGAAGQVEALGQASGHGRERFGEVTGAVADTSATLETIAAASQQVAAAAGETGRASNEVARLAERVTAIAQRLSDDPSEGA